MKKWGNLLDGRQFIEDKLKAKKVKWGNSIRSFEWRLKTIVSSGGKLKFRSVAKFWGLSRIYINFKKIWKKRIFKRSIIIKTIQLFQGSYLFIIQRDWLLGGSTGVESAGCKPFFFLKRPILFETSSN